MLLLFTGRRAKTDYFEQVPGGIALTPAGRAALIESFNERLDRSVRYAVQSKPGKHRNVKRRDVIRYEAHALANRLLGKTDLPRVVETRQLWDESSAPNLDDDADLVGDAGSVAIPPPDPDEDDPDLNPALPSDAPAAEPVGPASRAGPAPAAPAAENPPEPPPC